MNPQYPLNIDIISFIFSETSFTPVYQILPFNYSPYSLSGLNSVLNPNPIHMILLVSLTYLL